VQADAYLRVLAEHGDPRTGRSFADASIARRPRGSSLKLLAATVPRYTANSNTPRISRT
jgi:hypothetical protein